MKSYWAVIEYIGHTVVKARGETPREAAESVLADYETAVAAIDEPGGSARVVDLIDRATGEAVPVGKWGQENGASGEEDE